MLSHYSGAVVRKGRGFLSVGQAISQSRKEKGITQQQLAMKWNYSREAISKYETEDRGFPEELRQVACNDLDDPYVITAVEEEATGGLNIPDINGDYIDTHPAALSYLVQREADEALQHVRQMDWIKPVKHRSEQEKQEMYKVLLELLDAVASMKKLIAVICKEYKFSIKELIKAWRITLKARYWKK